MSWGGWGNNQALGFGNGSPFHPMTGVGCFPPSPLMPPCEPYPRPGCGPGIGIPPYGVPYGGMPPCGGMPYGMMPGIRPFDPACISNPLLCQDVYSPANQCIIHREFEEEEELKKTKRNFGQFLNGMTNQAVNCFHAIFTLQGAAAIAATIGLGKVTHGAIFPVLAGLGAITGTYQMVDGANQHSAEKAGEGAFTMLASLLTVGAVPKSYAVGDDVFELRIKHPIPPKQPVKGFWGKTGRVLSSPARGIQRVSHSMGKSKPGGWDSLKSAFGVGRYYSRNTGENVSLYTVLGRQFSNKKNWSLEDTSATAVKGSPIEQEAIAPYKAKFKEIEKIDQQLDELQKSSDDAKDFSEKGGNGGLQYTKKHSKLHFGFTRNKRLDMNDRKTVNGFQSHYNQMVNERNQMAAVTRKQMLDNGLDPKDYAPLDERTLYQ